MQQVRYRFAFTPGYRAASWCAGIFLGSLTMFGIDLMWLHYATSWLPGEESHVWWGVGIIAGAFVLLYWFNDDGLSVFRPWGITILLEGCLLFLFAR